jgi:hypothetical protein
MSGEFTCHDCHLSIEVPADEPAAGRPCRCPGLAWVVVAVHWPPTAGNPPAAVSGESGPGHNDSCKDRRYFGLIHTGDGCPCHHPPVASRD